MNVGTLMFQDVCKSYIFTTKKDNIPRAMPHFLGKRRYKVDLDVMQSQCMKVQYNIERL